MQSDILTRKQHGDGFWRCFVVSSRTSGIRVHFIGFAFVLIFPTRAAIEGARTGVSALQRSGLFSSALQRSDLFFISAPALRLPSPLHAPTQFCLALQRSESFCQALQRSDVPFRSSLSNFHGRNYLMVWPLNVYYSLTPNGGGSTTQPFPNLSQILPVHAHHSKKFLRVGQLFLRLCAKWQVSISSQKVF